MKYPSSWQDYEILDFGNGRKLERFGDIITDRPEPSATTSLVLSRDEWNKAHIHFTENKNQKGTWNKKIEDFEIEYPFSPQPIMFKLSQGTFKHLGVFPEQADNWEFISHRCKEFSNKGITPKILNLFAYTGGASLAANLSGAEVTHVDSSKSVVTWARQNADLNQIDTIRWILEDARKFVEKSVRRGDQYHGIIMDPPIFGLAPKGKPWKLNQDLPDLIKNTLKILHPLDCFFILNTYSPQLPLNDLKKMLSKISGFPNHFESTTLGLKSSTGKKLELGNLIRF
ncbi:MAG: class I SAM-dependent methyltransferase [Balneolaceae bacterium]